MTAHEQQRYQAIRFTSIMTALVNAVLAALKILFGLTAHSHALFADGIHSFADLISDVIVMLAAKYGSMTRDHDHPYGHGKIETLGTTVLSLVLVAVGVGIAIDALSDILTQQHEIPEWMVLVVAGISIMANELIFHYAKHIAIQFNSNLLLANAWHHRSDALSSVVVLMGASGAMLGWHYLDAVAAVVVAMMIVQMAWKLVWRSLRELIESAADPDTLAQIKLLIQQVSGVLELHECRTRTMRGNIIVDVHIIVDAYISVSEGHHIAQQVRKTLQSELPQVIDVTVHVDPEDDELYPPSIDLPSREALKERFAPIVSSCPGYADMKMDLHYLAGQLHVNIVLSKDLLSEYSAQEIELGYQQIQHQIDYVSQVSVQYQ